MTDFEKTLSNLKMVVEKLPKLTEEIPEIMDGFEMGVYGCYDGLTKEDIERGECKGSGCGLSNIARVFDTTNPKYYDDEGRFDYERFCEVEFPALADSYSWCYLFDECWGVASINSDFDSFMMRISSLCDYANDNGTFNIKRFSYETNGIIE